MTENKFPLPDGAKKDHNFDFHFEGIYYTYYVCSKCKLICVVVLDNAEDFLRPLTSKGKQWWYMYNGKSINNYTCVDMMIKDIIE